MPDRPHPSAPWRRRPDLAVTAAIGLAAIIVLGALIFYLPIVRRHGALPAEIPNPPALFATSHFTVPGHGRACMPMVTVTPQSHSVVFSVSPVAPAPHGGPPMQLVLDGSGYHATVGINGGYPGGAATLPLTPPARPVITTACFRDLGIRPLQLLGTDEARTVSRSSPVVVNGQAAAGDIALAFYDNPAVGLRYRAHLAVQHASNLTDGLLSPDMVWIVGVLAFLGVPALFVGAWRLALRDT